MRLDEFASNDVNQSAAAALGIMNFLKKQAKRKSKEGQLSVAAFENMMSMGKGGGADVTSYLDDFVTKGVIDNYDDQNIFYNSDSTETPPDMGMDAPMPPADPMMDPMMADPMSAPIDPMAAPPGPDPMAPAPQEMEPEFVEPDPVEAMAKSAALKRI